MTEHTNLLTRAERYMRTMPLEKRLMPLLPEIRIIKLTQLAKKAMPPLACFVFVWQIVLGGQWGPAIATALFACSLPFQGLYWLGQRAKKPLSISQITWFDKIQQQLKQKNVAVPTFSSPLTYMELAILLNLAIQHLGQEFLQEL